MKIIFLITFCTLILNANISEDGKKLYDDANCKKCHLDGAKFDPNSIKKEGLTSKIKDKSGIHKWVVSCDSFFSIGWFPEEHDSVTEYLNRVYYKYDTKSKKSK